MLPDDPETAAILEQTLAKTFAQTLTGEAPEPPASDSPVPQSGVHAAVANSRPPIRGGNPANPGQFSKTLGSGQRERETKSPVLKDNLGKKFDPEHPCQRQYSARENALKKATSGKPVDVRDAMHKEGLGRIDFYLGWEGKGPALEHGKRMVKLIQKHPDELESLPETIAKGTVCKIKSEKTGTFSKYASAAIQDSKIAFLSKNDSGWVVTSHYTNEKVAREIITYNKNESPHKTEAS